MKWLLLPLLFIAAWLIWPDQKQSVNYVFVPAEKINATTIPQVTDARPSLNVQPLKQTTTSIPKLPTSAIVEPLLADIIPPEALIIEEITSSNIEDYPNEAVLDLKPTLEKQRSTNKISNHLKSERMKQKENYKQASLVSYQLYTLFDSHPIFKHQWRIYDEVYHETLTKLIGTGISQTLETELVESIKQTYQYEDITDLYTICSPSDCIAMWQMPTNQYLPKQGCQALNLNEEDCQESFDSPKPVDTQAYNKAMHFCFNTWLYMTINKYDDAMQKACLTRVLRETHVLTYSQKSAKGVTVKNLKFNKIGLSDRDYKEGLTEEVIDQHKNYFMEKEDHETAVTFRFCENNYCVFEISNAIPQIKPFHLAQIHPNYPHAFHVVGCEDISDYKTLEFKDLANTKLKWANLVIRCQLPMEMGKDAGEYDWYDED
jgi:hypothetical protein